MGFLLVFAALFAAAFVMMSAIHSLPFVMILVIMYVLVSK
jgi:hypothetical protein